MWQYNYSDEYLCHWGIKGMKWGVRRYQNKDGSLTPQGRARYSDGSSKKTKSASSDTSTSSASSKKNVSVRDLSDDELDRMISRLQKEKQLKSLMYEDVKQSPTTTTGKKYFSTALKEGTSQALSTIVKSVALYLGAQAVAKIFNNPELGKSISSSIGAKDNKDKDEAKSEDEEAKSKSKFNFNFKSKSKSKTNPFDIPLDADFTEVFEVKFKDISGEGSSKKYDDDSTIIDVDYRDVVDKGSEFVNRYLMLPEYKE